MLKGQLYINDTDAYEMGISMDSSALSALMTPPSKKEWVTNAVREEVGEEYLKSEVPKADKRQCTDGKVDGGGAQWVVINGSGQWRTLGYTPQFEDTGGAWVRRSHTWRWGDSFSQAIKDAPKDLAAGDEFVIGCNPSSSVVNIGIRRLKLEVGNKRTDWGPAPEDVDDAIEAAKKAAVEQVDVMYALGASATTAPTSGWQTAAPAWQAGKYMWQRTDITTGDGVLHTGAPTCIQGAAGAAGRGIKSVQEQYYLSTSRTAQSGGSWQTAQPAWSAGRYVWTRSLITYSDSTTGYSAATLSELFNKANETAATASSTAAAAQTAATTAKNAADTANSTANAARATANSAIALTGDPDNVFTDQFLTGLSNTSDVAPPKGKARLCNNRDNWFGNEIAVSQGAKVVIEATVMRHPSDTSTIPPRFGLWLTDKDDGINPWGWYSLGEDMGVVGMTADWHKWRRVATVPGGMRKGRFFLQIERSATLDGQNTQGSFYVSNIVVKMEARDYLREALEEASSGTTDVSGGLVLSKMMSVRDANGVMVAGMSGTSAASNGELPMIWAGAAANTTSGIDGASFRVYSDGRAVMRRTQIVGDAGKNAVMVDGVGGVVKLGVMNTDGDDIEVPKTTISANTYSTVYNALSIFGANGTLVGTISVSGGVSLQSAEPSYYAYAGGVTVFNNTTRRTLATFNIPSTAKSGTIYFKVQEGRISTSLTMTTTVSLGYYGDGTQYAGASFLATVLLLCKNGETLMAIGHGNATANAMAEEPTRRYGFGNHTVPKREIQQPYVPGDVFTVVMEQKVAASAPMSTLGTDIGPFIKTIDAFSRIPNQFGITYSNATEVYSNVIFGNGQMMSSAPYNYFCIVPEAKPVATSPIFEAAAGMNASEACYIRLTPRGLLHRYPAQTGWFKLNPIVYACKMNFENGGYRARDEFNPHKLSVSAQKASNGVVTVTHGFGKVNLPQVTAISPDRWLFAHVQSYDSNSTTVRLIDRDGSFWNVPFVITLLDFNQY